MSESKKLPTVEVAIACYSGQPQQWWTSVFANLMAENKDTCEITRINASASMLNDRNKNDILMGEIPNAKRRADMTDANRNILSKGFMAEDSEYIFWIDDDTVPPAGALGRLLSLKRQFVSGLYFLNAYPYNPIAYYHNKDGTYTAMYNYPAGALLEVDSIGMGCALIHRSVYEKILEEHKCYTRPDGSICVLHKSQIKDKKVFTGNNRKEFLSNGVLKTPLMEMDMDDDRAFPFYQLNYCRTEDHFFCELAENVGIKPYVDTTIVCDHWKLKATNDQDYDAVKERALAEIEGKNL